MNSVHICSRGSVSRRIYQHNITHVLSLLDRGVRPYLPPSFDKTKWRLFHMEDITDPRMPYAPTKEQVEKVLEWGRELPEDANLLVHCEAGMSRSTAMALALMVQKDGIDSIEANCTKLVEIRDCACPNQLIIRYADDLLAADGRLIKAADEVVQAFLDRFMIPGHGAIKH